MIDLIAGDAREVLRLLGAGSVQTVVTSPPYWGLRDYKIEPVEWADGTTSSLGLEPTPDLYVAHLVEVFREVWRVLRDDGTVWLNLGSSYAGGASTGGCSPKSTLSGGGGKYRAGSKNEAMFNASGGRQPTRSRPDARAYDNGGTAPQDSTDVDSVCSGLCDGCLADFVSHRARTVGTPQQPSRSERQPSRTARDSEPTGSASASAGASLPDVQASTNLESWRQHRGACSRCDSRASALSGARSSSGGVLPFAHMTWLDYTTRLKHKDMVPIPWLVAMALQADGWYLRSDIIWAKAHESFGVCEAVGSAMPESVRDRPTRAHEYLFLLTKSPRYYYDSEAARSPLVASTVKEFSTAYRGQGTKDYAGAKAQNPSDVKRRIIGEHYKHDDATRFGKRGANYAKYEDASGVKRRRMVERGRNLRDVWFISPRPFKEAHFATFPPELVRPCVEIGSSPAQCSACGTPYRHVVEKTPIPPEVRAQFEAARRATVGDTGRTDGHTQRKPNFTRDVIADRHEPDCFCGLAAPAEPQTVLDPFCGAGTVGLVCQDLGRDFIGIDINGTYIDQIARPRLDHRARRRADAV